MSRSPSDAELLSTAIESLLLDVHTCMPGKIVAYNERKQLADVQPMLRRRQQHEDGSELVESFPVLPDVPVHFLRAAGFFMSFPLQKDDLVVLHFAEQSLDSYLSGNGSESDAGDFRRHDMSDAIAVPGLYPSRRAIADVHSANLVLGMDDGGAQIHITPDGVMEIRVNGEAEEAAALGNALQLFWDNVFKPVFDAHLHPTGLGPSGPPAPPCPSFDKSVISKILKISK